MATVKYEGPTCYVSPGGTVEGPDGRLLDGGYHYSVIEDTDAKQAAIAGVQAQVELWEKRAALGGGQFTADQLENAKEALAAIEEAPFHIPDQKLYLDDGGTYYLAEDGDLSWHDRKHQRFASFNLEDGSDGIRVTEEELGPMKTFLDELRSKGGGQ
jgi:hypothetical protein